MDKITSFFTKTDCFSSPHRVLYGSSPKYNTLLGGLLTIVAALFSCFVSIFFGRELIFRSKPFITNSNKPTQLQEISLKSLGLMFFISSREADILSKDPEFMKGIQFVAATASFTAEGKKAVASYTPLRVLPCSKDLIDADYWDFMSQQVDLTSFFCIYPYKDTPTGREEIKIKGEMTNLGANVVNISVRLCNEEANPGCRAKINYYGIFFVQLTMKESFFTSSNESSPITFINKSFSLVAGTDQTVFQDINFQKNVLSDDRGFIFEWPEETEYYSLGSFSYQSRPLYDTYSSVADIRVGTINVLNLNSRRYMKLQELLADIGGFIKALLLFGKFVGSSYSKYKFSIVFEKDNTAPKRRDRTATFRPQNSSSISAVELRQSNKVSNTHLSFFSYYFRKYFKNTLDERKINAFFDLKTLNSRISSLEEKIELKEDKR